MDTFEILKEIETKLRRPDTDRQYLASQLVVLASLIALDDKDETGLVRGALGGMQYAIDRLREIWRNPYLKPKTLDELKDIYAQVELKRFAKTNDDIESSREAFRKDAMLYNTHRLEIPNGETYYVFSSKVDQTTVDGRKVLQGEILDASCSLIPSFQIVYQELLKQKR